MQIKAADDRSADIDELERLSARRDLPPAVRHRIEDELRSIRAGIEGEKQAAYEIERTFSRSRKFVTIHDLRFEVGGFPVQIDHLVLNMLGEIWVCESKHFADGATINERGEWTRRWGRHEFGMESPIAQNRHHILLLGRAFDDGLLPKYKRLGALPMRPSLRSLVLISKKAQMKWPRRHLPELNEVIKVEDIDKHVFDAIDGASSWKLLSVVSPSALLRMGENLVALHDPKRIDWTARFGLDASRDAPQTPRPSSVASGSHAAAARPSSPSPIAAGRVCDSCDGPITEKEVFFSTVRLRHIYGGRPICRVCQDADRATQSA